MIKTWICIEYTGKSIKCIKLEQLLSVGAYYHVELKRWVVEYEMINGKVYLSRAKNRVNALYQVEQVTNAISPKDPE